MVLCVHGRSLETALEVATGLFQDDLGVTERDVVRAASICPLVNRGPFRWGLQYPTVLPVLCPCRVGSHCPLLSSCLSIDLLHSNGHDSDCGHFRHICISTSTSGLQVIQCNAQEGSLGQHRANRFMACKNAPALHDISSTIQ